MTYRSALGWLAPVACVLLAMAVQGALAQGTVATRAKLAAKTYAPLPADFGVTVVHREDTELNRRLHGVFERELKERGYQVGEDTDYVLRFESLVEEKLSADKPASVVGRGGNRSGGEIGFQLRLPLDKPKPAVGGRRYSLNVSLARRGQPPIWVASAVAIAAHGDRFAVQRAMVKAIVGALGQDADSRPIVID